MSSKKVSMNGLTAVKRDLTKEESDILDEFHSVVFKILKIAKKLEPNNLDLEWLHNKLYLAREVDPLLIMNRAKEKLFTYRKEILSKDEDFFLKNNFSAFIKNDENKTFLYTLLNLIKKRFNERTDAEKAEIWRLAQKMLESVLKYKKLEIFQNNF